MREPAGSHLNESIKTRESSRPGIPHSAWESTLQTVGKPVEEILKKEEERLRGSDRQNRQRSRGRKKKWPKTIRIDRRPAGRLPRDQKAPVGAF